MDESRHITVAISGYRTSKLSSASADSNICDDLYRSAREYIKALYGEGYRRFIAGGAVGFDMICARAILSLRAELADIHLTIAAPFSTQQHSYAPAQREEYEQILSLADDVQYISQEFHDRAYLDRNDFMLRHASVLLCYYDGRRGGTMYTYNRAKKLTLRIVNLCVNYVGSENDQLTLF